MDDKRETRTAGTWLPVAAILLLTLGVLLLLNTTGVVGWGVWWPLFDWWPLILIAIGLNIILAPRFPIISAIVVALVLTAGVIIAYLSSLQIQNGDILSDTFTLSSSNTAVPLELDIDFGSGSLVIDAIASQYANEVIVVDFNNLEGDADHVITENGIEITLSADSPGLLMRSDGSGWQSEINLFGLLDALVGSGWDVELSPDIAEIILDIEGGAVDMDLRLAELSVKTLDMDIGAADVDITLPANAGHTDVYIEAGAADIYIAVPDNVAALIESDSALISLDVDESRFPKTDGIYQSPDYDTARNRVEINIDAGASSVSIH